MVSQVVRLAWWPQYTPRDSNNNQYRWSIIVFHLHNTVMLQYVHVALSHQTNEHQTGICSTRKVWNVILLFRCGACEAVIEGWWDFYSFFFLPSSTCFFSTSPTSHYLIGHFQVGFMRAKLISVSKFREQERGWKKGKHGWMYCSGFLSGVRLITMK